VTKIYEPEKLEGVHTGASGDNYENCSYVREPTRTVCLRERG